MTNAFIDTYIHTMKYMLDLDLDLTIKMQEAHNERIKNKFIDILGTYKFEKKKKMGKQRLEKNKNRLVPGLVTAPDLIFSTSLNSRGFYHDLLQGLIRDSSKVISIAKEDKSAYTQIKSKANKAGLKLLIAENEACYYFKLFKLTEPQMEIMRSIYMASKTINELRALKVEGKLDSELQSLSKLGFIKLSPQGKWFILDGGKEYINGLEKDDED